ncbi:hypothetical protein ES702_03435 [subsurface metagenome]
MLGGLAIICSFLRASTWTVSAGKIGQVDTAGELSYAENVDSMMIVPFLSFSDVASPHFIPFQLTLSQLYT